MYLLNILQVSNKIANKSPGDRVYMLHTSSHRIVQSTPEENIATQCKSCTEIFVDLLHWLRVYHAKQSAMSVSTDKLVPSACLFLLFRIISRVSTQENFLRNGKNSSMCMHVKKWQSTFLYNVCVYWEFFLSMENFLEWKRGLSDE